MCIYANAPMHICHTRARVCLGAMMCACRGPVRRFPPRPNADTLAIFSFAIQYTIFSPVLFIVTGSGQRCACMDFITKPSGNPVKRLVRCLSCVCAHSLLCAHSPQVCTLPSAAFPAILTHASHNVLKRLERCLSCVCAHSLLCAHSPQVLY